MSFCIVCFLRRFYGSHQQTSLRQQDPFFSDIATELGDLLRFSLNSLTALLPVLAMSGSKTLQPIVLMLLIYTFTLRLAVNTCFLRNYPVLSRFLHVVPLLGACCAAGVVLVSNSPTPVLATIGLLLSVLPLVTIAVHHGRLCGETSTAELPIQMQDATVSGPAASGSIDTIPSA